MTNGGVVRIKQIYCYQNDEIVVKGEKFEKVQESFDYPVKFSKIGIMYVEKFSSNSHKYYISSIEKNAYLQN